MPPDRASTAAESSQPAPQIERRELAILASADVTWTAAIDVDRSDLAVSLELVLAVAAELYQCRSCMACS
jgi:hypothetical protein